MAIKIVKNQKLYFAAIIPCNNFIQTQNQVPNNEIIFFTPASLYSAFWGSLQTEVSLKKVFKD